MATAQAEISVALVDDHTLLRTGLANLIDGLEGYSVSFQADNGLQFIEFLKKEKLPDIVLLDVNMKEMNGYDTAMWLKKNHPTVIVIALSMFDNEYSIIKMLQHGARGYLLKDTHPREFKIALDTVMNKGYYYTDMVTGMLIHAVSNNSNEQQPGKKGIAKLNDRETDFLKFICTEMTYKEIADKMSLSPRTIDGYRDILFERLNIKTRVGLAMYAIRSGIVQLS